ncbi:MAG: electron transport complex subunit RsxE [Caldisericia bacterium]|nr:electron transport complex subunit RsxE [Caldisericia bacterium]
MINLKQVFLRGVLQDNPVLILMIGLCSVLAVSVTTVNAIGMTVAYSFVLIGSELTISAIRNVIPKTLRIPIFIIAIGTFTTIIQLIVKAYSPSLDKSLGIFIPLIVVNCIIIGRVEAFSSKNTVLASLVDSLGMSIGYGIVIISIAFIRELLGSGTIFGFSVYPPFIKPMLIFVLPPGAFFIIGIEIAILSAINKRLAKSKG